MRHPLALASLTSLVLLMAALLGGCAARSAVIATPEQEATTPAPSTAAEGWWYVRFGLHWPAGAEPAWHRDLLLADQVVRPALSQHREAISLWRFHRRAARDGAGHRFSFIFRASPASAARIYDQIRTNATLATLQRRGMVESVGFDDLSRIERPGVADTSDQAWSPQMQAAWPSFIMGVSQLWLDLIEQIGDDSGLPRGLNARYKAIDASLSTIWRTEGSHALLHHLNALFGYRPVIVTTQAPMRF